MLGLLSLQKRHLRGDMIETDKIMQRMDRVDSWGSSFPFHITRTRGCPLKLNVGKLGTDKRKYFFTQVGPWNSLPQVVVMASGLSAFKKGLAREERTITGYKP